MLAWLLGAGLGPAAVALPVNWGAEALADAAKRWFKRVRRKDGLSRIVRAATGSSVDLTRTEFDAVRGLLEDQQTWVLLGQATVEDLATRIASCLPPRDGRKDADSRAAALTITRGLLEFAVADLEPSLFQQLLLARLQRMETGQSSRLDEALFDIHADLMIRFADVMECLKGVLDRLPPSPAGRGEIVVYLSTLIEWMNTDPWPQDQRFVGPMLTPAKIERNLRLTSKGSAGEESCDADVLAEQCQRLVILGGPGSGKTWLARRTARRCAERALEALAGGGELDVVELPLYTTCSHLFSNTDDDIRRAVVSSALAQLADLGGTRLVDTLRTFFSERKTGTVLIIDGLDEARGSSERLRQADTLPWRVILTSRPNSWNHQFLIEGDKESHRVGELQPLRYPEDVESFIRHWFSPAPDWGNGLAAEIARRRDLQEAATVPLILAFYCIVGGGQLLPQFRCELHAKVIRRMLTGRWRRESGSNDCHPDVEACLEALRAWAWLGASSNPKSGLGAWADEISAGSVRMDTAEHEAVDHVATPLGFPDIDSGKTSRRFIHRSIREYLVSDHVARLQVHQAVECLMPHLWYDPDWEYAVPAAIAMHPDRNRLLRDLICRAAGSVQIPADLSVIDGGHEFQYLLAQVATESSEVDWSPELATIIGQARVELARLAYRGNLRAVSWEISNCQAREALLTLLADRAGSGRDPQELVEGLLQFEPTAEDQRLARNTLLRLLSTETNSMSAAGLVRGLIQLDPPEADKRQACELLLRSLANPDRGWMPVWLVSCVIRLDATQEDRRQAREILLRLLADPPEDRNASDGMVIGLVRLDPTQEDKRQARKVVLGSLVNTTDSYNASQLVNTLARLGPTQQDKREGRKALFGVLADPANNRNYVKELVEGLVQLGLTQEEQRQARKMLLGFLANRPPRGEYWTGPAVRFVDALARLNPTRDEQRQARKVLLALLTESSPLWEPDEVIRALVQLALTVEDKRQTREMLLGLLPNPTTGASDGYLLRSLAKGVDQLNATVPERHRVREALLDLLVNPEVSWREGPRLVTTLIDVSDVPHTPGEDKYRIRETLLSLLADPANGFMSNELAYALTSFDPTAEEKRRARDALRVALASRENQQRYTELAHSMSQLDPTVHDLTTWPAAVSLTHELLSSVRRNSSLVDWLAALPLLPSLSDRPARLKRKSPS